MNERNDDPGIPTLTHRAPARRAPPVLTETTADIPPWDTPANERFAVPGRAGQGEQYASTHHPVQSHPIAQPAPRHETMPPAAPARDVSADAVLRAALQADIEDAVQDAMDEAMHLVRARLEARLPEIVANAIRRTRIG